MPDTILTKRLRNIMDTLTHNIYNYGCTGIFEKHKLLFSFQITIKLEQDVGNVTQEEVDFFIKVSPSERKIMLEEGVLESFVCPNLPNSC